MFNAVRANFLASAVVVNRMWVQKWMVLCIQCVVVGDQLGQVVLDYNQSCVMHTTHSVLLHMTLFSSDNTVGKANLVIGGLSMAGMDSYLHRHISSKSTS